MNRAIPHISKRRNGAAPPDAAPTNGHAKNGASVQSWYNTPQAAEPHAIRAPGRLPAEAETHSPRFLLRGATDMQTHPEDLDTYVDGLANAVYKGMEDEVGPYGLSPLEFNLLRACMRQDECTATQLAEILPVDASRISRVVTKLVDSGLLRRRRLRNDRRIVMLRLTDAGNELTSQIDRRLKVYDAKLTEGVTEDEMSGFVTTTSKILANHAALLHSN